MIIRYPTGLYRNILPSKPQDSGNITFTVSNTTPPRTNLVFPKVPVGLVNRGRERPSPADPIVSRQYYGELSFTVSSAQRQQTGNNTKQFEIGQVLDFDIGSQPKAEPMLVRPATEIQHNNNLFDYQALGMTSDEQTLVAQQSLTTHSKLVDQLNAAKQQRADAELEVNIQQKLINETTKTISALEVIAQDDVAELVIKLKKKRDEAFAARNAAIAVANTSATLATTILSKLRTVATVVK